MIQQLYGHAVIGDTPDALRYIQRDDINVVACPFPMDAAAIDYVDALDLRWDGDLMTDIRERNPGAQSFNAIVLATMFFEPETDPLPDVVHARLNLLPDAPGKRELSEAMVTASLLYAAQAAAGKRLEIQVKVKYPMATGAWHGDNGLDTRCFATLNVKASGTYGRPDRTILDWESRIDEYDNDFGIFGKEYMEDVFVIPSRYMAIWKGWVHRRPFIHAEVTSEYSTTPRLVVMVQR